jgi:hypothetical protein
MRTSSTVLALLFAGKISASQVSSKLQASQVVNGGASFAPNVSTFDEAKLGTPSERFFLTHESLGHQMDSVMADIKAADAAFVTTQMQALRDALTCSESLARLFPEDIAGNNTEMIKIASAFLNHAHTAVDGMPAEAPIREELSIINAIIKAASCPTCDVTGNTTTAIDGNAEITTPNTTGPEDADTTTPDDTAATTIDTTDCTRHEMVNDPSAAD